MWSIFNYGIQMENCVRLRNSRTLATVELSNEAYASLSSNSDKSGSVKDIAGQLARLGLWVESRDDECEKYLANLKNDVEGLTGDASLIVAVTRQCNLACKYCYENGSCREGTFGKLDIENLKKIARWLVSKGCKNIDILLFGGEPLVVGIPILANVIHCCDGLAVSRKLHLITNGTLLSHHKVALFEKEHLNSLQVTLDGSQEYHDSMKTFKDGRGTFNLILDNLVYAMKHNIAEEYIIRVNCTDENIFGIEKFLREIKNRFESPHHITFSLGMVGRSFKVCKMQTSIDRIASNCSLSENAINEFVRLHKIIRDAGFFIPDYFAYSALCSNKTALSIVLEPGLRATKCTSAIGIEELSKGADDLSLFSRKTPTSLYRRCFSEECPYVPFCHLGCQHEGLIDGASIPCRICQREVLDRINTGLLRTMF